MYTFVADKLDIAYTSAIPENHQLREYDVPEEEMELREIIELWYECSFLPAFNLQQIDFANKAELTLIQTHVLNNDTETVAFLLKNRVYRAALKRILGVWSLEPSAKCVLEQLLLEVSRGQTH